MFDPDDFSYDTHPDDRPSRSYDDPWRSGDTLRDDHPAAVDRTTPDRLAAGIIWVVGKANGTLGPTGPVVQKEVSEVLGSPTLSQCSHLVYGHVRRIGWARPRPWRRDVNDLLATGRIELLGRQTRADLVRLRDEALEGDRSSRRPVASTP